MSKKTPEEKISFFTIIQPYEMVPLDELWIRGKVQMLGATSRKLQLRQKMEDGHPVVVCFRRRIVGVAIGGPELG